MWFRGHESRPPPSLRELFQTAPMLLIELFEFVRLSGPLVAHGGVVGFRDDVRIDGSEPLAEALASLPQEVERVRGGTMGAVLWVRSMLLDEMRLKGRGDFIRRL
jgi:hypothetical protein